MVQFMSQGDFASGGPQANSGVTGAAGGFGQLAQVLAQGPMMHAKAGYMAAETDKARAETDNLHIGAARAQGRQDRIQEAMGILSNPQSIRDPNAMARIYAIGMADPEIAPHLNSILGGTMAAMALNKVVTQAEADKYSAGTGVAAYGNTATGQGAELANRTQNIRVTGQEQRATDDNQTIEAMPPNAGPGTRPVAMTRGQARTQGYTMVSPEEQTQGAGFVNVRPAGTSATTPPVAMPRYQLVPGQSSLISPEQQREEGELTQVAGPTGPVNTTRAGAIGLPPVLSPDQIGAGMLQSQFGGPGGSPITLPSGGGPAASGQVAGPAAPSQPGQPPPPQQLPNAFMDRAAEFNRARNLVTGPQTPIAPLDAAKSAEFDQYIGTQAGTMYPSNRSAGMWGGGTTGVFGPDTTGAIKNRAMQLYTQRGPTQGDVGASVNQAIQELQRTGQLSPNHPMSGYSGPGSVRFGGENVIRLNPPDTKYDAQGNPVQGPATTNTGPASTQPQTPQQMYGGTGSSAPAQTPAQAQTPAAGPATQFGVNPTTGQRIGLIGGQWVPVDAQGNPQAQATR